MILDVPNSVRYLSELAAGLGWRSTTELVMLWGYFDESGVHDEKSGRLRALTVGGCVATLKAWRNFCPDWQAALDTEPDVKCFHMTDFEHFRGRFDWSLPDGRRDHERHRRFLDRLLDAITSHVDIHIGCTNFVDPEDERSTEDLLIKGITDMVMTAYKEHHLLGDRIRMVFAHHNEVKEGRVRDYHRLLDGPKSRVAGVSVERPEELLPLQAADLVAYELARGYRENRPPRYPSERLKSSSRVMKTVFRAGGVPDLGS